jgi:rhamnogalacturonyl hydrolase YesR
MSATLQDLQNDNGYWPVSLAAGELYPSPESSGTAFFVAGMAWGINNGILDQADYLPNVRNGWSALLKAQKDDGMLGYVQQVGYAPDKVSPDETQLYGAGAFLLAGTEVLQLADKL